MGKYLSGKDVYQVTRHRIINYDSLQQVISFADGVIVSNPNMSYESFTIEPYTEYDESYCRLEYLTDETDRERELRVKQEEERNALTERYQRQQYEQLKKKFEG